MNVYCFITSFGIPDSSLTPKLKLRNVNIGNVLEVDMISLGDGFYAYDFVNYVEGNEYTALIDTQAEWCDSGRYIAGIVSDKDSLSSVAKLVWNEDLTDFNAENSAGATLKLAKGTQNTFGGTGL